ncbi:hypothetical protein BH09PSE3_BH09PSE3_28520 [soil metagenome]
MIKSDAMGVGGNTGPYLFGCYDVCRPSGKRQFADISLVFKKVPLSLAEQAHTAHRNGEFRLCGGYGQTDRFSPKAAIPRLVLERHNRHLFSQWAA